MEALKAGNHPFAENDIDVSVSVVVMFGLASPIGAFATDEGIFRASLVDAKFSSFFVAAAASR